MENWTDKNYRAKCPPHVLKEFVDVIAISEGQRGEELCLEMADIILTPIFPKQESMDSANCQLINLGVSVARNWAELRNQG